MAVTRTQEKLSAKEIIEAGDALACVLRISDHPWKKIISQLKQPSTVRPIRTIPAHIDRSTRYNPRTNLWQKRNITTERGAPKDKAHTKKICTTLLPRDGQIHLFQPSEDALLTLLFKAELCDLKGEKYIFLEDFNTNSKWWLRNTTKKSQSVHRSLGLNELKQVLIADRQKGIIPNYNEVMVGVSREALIGISIVKNIRIARLHALLKKQLLMNELNTLLPILIIEFNQPILEYSEAMQKEDVIACSSMLESEPEYQLLKDNISLLPQNLIALFEDSNKQKKDETIGNTNLETMKLEEVYKTINSSNTLDNDMKEGIKKIQEKYFQLLSSKIDVNDHATRIKMLIDIINDGSIKEISILEKAVLHFMLLDRRQCHKFFKNAFIENRKNHYAMVAFVKFSLCEDLNSPINLSIGTLVEYHVPTNSNGGWVQSGKTYSEYKIYDRPWIIYALLNGHHSIIKAFMENHPELFHRNMKDLNDISDHRYIEIFHDKRFSEQHLTQVFNTIYSAAITLGDKFIIDFLHRYPKAQKSIFHAVLSQTHIPALRWYLALVKKGVLPRGMLRGLNNEMLTNLITEPSYTTEEMEYVIQNIPFQKILIELQDHPNLSYLLIAYANLSPRNEELIHKINNHQIIIKLVASIKQIDSKLSRFPERLDKLKDFLDDCDKKFELVNLFSLDIQGRYQSQQPFKIMPGLSPGSSSALGIVPSGIAKILSILDKKISTLDKFKMIAEILQGKSKAIHSPTFFKKSRDPELEAFYDKYAKLFNPSEGKKLTLQATSSFSL